MKSILAASAALFMALNISSGTAHADDFDVVIGRYREILLRSATGDEATLKNHIATLGADGRWTDIDYADRQPSGWKTMEHLNRIKALSRAIADEKHPLHNDAAAQAAIDRALDHWIEKRYKNPNWWHNDIGVPMAMRDILVLLGHRVQGPRFAGALEVLHQYGTIAPGQGANTMWTAELAMMYGALTRDAKLVTEKSTVIANEIRISNGEGIQPDYSYYQHGARLQQFHYGGAFLSDASRLGWQLRGTPWAIPEAKLQIVADTILRGSQWMVRSTSTVPGTLDRAISRRNAQRADLRGVARNLREASPLRAAELDALIARQDGTGAPLVGFRSYPRSDFAAFHRPGFTFFLKTISSRTLGTESINVENLKGRLLNSGDHYLLRHGQEYIELPPVWDWNLLPGVTHASGAGNIVRQPFVGATGNDASGLSAMDYRFVGEYTSLSARKMWASHGDVVVCLIGGLQGIGFTSPVQTALDQSALRGEVTVADGQGNLKTLADGTYPAQSLRWAHHGGFAYIPFGAPVSLRLGPVTGTWQSINRAGSPSPVTLPVFLPVLEHGVAPRQQASGFAIALAAAPQDAAAVFAKPSWQILRNDAQCQVVRFADGTLMSAFYEATQVNENGKTLLGADKPCLVMQKQNALWASDPTHKGGRFTFTTPGGVLTLNLPADGMTAKAP